MYRETLRYSWVEIDLDAIRHNIRSVKKHVDGRAKMVAVVKADAYGHGIKEIIKVMTDEGYDTFAVATVAEAVIIRQMGYKDVDIWHLGLSGPDYADIIIENDIIPSVDTLDYAKCLSDEAVRQKKKARVMIAFDTGMARIGYRFDEDFTGDIKKMDDLPNFEYLGMFSHICNADTSNKWYVDIQKDNLHKILDKLDKAGIDMKIKSFANSATVEDHPELMGTHVRPGILIYGYYSDNEINKGCVSLKPAMSIKATILRIREIEKGDCVGYGCAFTATRKTKIATFNVGYADGLPRSWGRCGYALVRGMKVPYAGNVCMDQAMLDVTDVPDVRIGDEIIIVGSDGKNSITMEEVAHATGRIHHEIITSAPLRLPRIYKNI